jgi:hypothetical protein
LRVRSGEEDARFFVKFPTLYHRKKDLPVVDGLDKPGWAGSATRFTYTIHGMNRSDPTPEMFAFYERRTNQHIERVHRCLALMAEATDHADELNERGRVHDASKFGAEELVPYIWLTEFHRCRRNREPFAYPAGMENRVRAAVEHHMTTNRHHPDFHSHPNEMSDVDLIEMVCDWTAMSQEFDQDGGSAREWADRTIGERVQFNDDKRRFIYDMIDLLDAKLKHDG